MGVPRHPRGPAIAPGVADDWQPIRKRQEPIEPLLVFMAGMMGRGATFARIAVALDQPFWSPRFKRRYGGDDK